MELIHRAVQTQKGTHGLAVTQAPTQLCFLQSEYLT